MLYLDSSTMRGKFSFPGGRGADRGVKRPISRAEKFPAGNFPIPGGISPRKHAYI
jgi:hypothetical protein